MYQLGFRRSSPWLIVVAVIIMAISLYGLLRITWFNRLAVRLTSPLQSGLYQASSAVGGWKSRAQLEQLVAALQQQLAETIIDTSQLRALEVENQTLREQLNFFEDEQYNFVVARIISSTADFNFSGFIVNRGRQAGVTVGAPVIVGDGIMIGEVVEVSDETSIVMLLTDSQSRLAVTVQNGDTTTGVMVGQHGLSMKMEMIPRNEVVTPHDIIVTSGLEADVPRGLVVGTVEALDTTDSDLFASATVRPLVDYGKLSIVTILIP